MRPRSPTTTASPATKVKILSWVLRLLAAAVFLAAGGAKLAGAQMMVDGFNQIGIGQWFRVMTGVVEVAGGIALVVPATAAFGGLMLAVTMVCAIMTHLFVIGGNPAPAFLLMVMTGTVAWLHRTSIADMLSRLRQR
ncbi:DoxX protein [Rhizobium leguminosarum bv. trifolii WSM2297]|uniref:DoxX protein n=1 Tax=Rhizobium leguminosarum bv. trifolii WSM2297 TaxID=754762 RepID=J0KX76_RHILT|nr:DoxX family protein [Rhizobium leguminosarum]EJC82354.1 DoxX protein [Rhizobium leguminosarum bv. trifolii WSM2297]